ncbi:ABC transporter ATP-binding protein [Aquabacter sp. L1I39]|uniref:ABC transporter ATP-binding protein n=1 Tax=Aquabacter sp. L1I39 TaxID=2820278 RepID=UPI001AD9E761|nr:ABC transporter ATP-binding protein [Aquabacter sp. L1I39]QTL02162.1 ABC transporter ATP-binding protein [Aquabacter sp. L1I39]
MTDPAMVVSGLTKCFGGVTVVDDVSFVVERGQILGLIGPNGAGKTTLFNLLSGVLKADGGRLAVNGTDATGLPPHRLARLGLVRTFQLARELDQLTVLENVMLAAQDNVGERLMGALLRPTATARAERDAQERAWEMLARVSLTPHAGKRAANLSGGQKKLLELARCLMAGADIILLDEIAAGVAPHLVEEIKHLIARLNRDHGTTFLVIEHNIGFIRDLSSRVVVMASGKVLAEGSFAHVAANPAVIESYLGQAA